MWGVEPKAGGGLWGLIRDRFLSFAALVGTGFLLLVSLVLSAVNCLALEHMKES
jgi:membrane protein